MTQLSSLDRIDSCLQCGKCTGGCPVSRGLELNPRWVLRALQLQVEEKARTSEFLWLCLGCQACSSRCPQGVDPAGILSELRLRAEGGGVVGLFDRAFLRTLRLGGRLWEVGLIAQMNLLTGRVFKDVNKVPGLIRKGKIRWPQRVRDQRGVSRIWAKGEQG